MFFGTLLSTFREHKKKIILSQRYCISMESDKAVLFLILKIHKVKMHLVTTRESAVSAFTDRKSLINVCENLQRVVRR